MSAQSLIRSSLESISHQRDTAFLTDMIEAVKTIRAYGDQLEDSSKRTDALNDSNVEFIINQYTGLIVNFIIKKDMKFDLAVLPPMIDSNHVLRPLMQSTGDEPHHLTALRKLKTQLIGGIDVEKGHVFGIYTQITSPIFMGLKFFTSRDRNGQWYFSEEEIAAMLLHEVGHVMTYYEYMGRTALLSHVLGQASQQFTNTTSSKKKIEITQATGDLLDIDSLETEAFGEIDDGHVFQSLIIAEYTMKKQSMTDTYFYDAVTFEALADQYVSRLGGARALTTALDKHNRITGKTATTRIQKEMHVITNSIFWGIMAIGSLHSWTVIAIGGLFIIGLTHHNLSPDEYDDPKDRLQRIRNDMVDRIKDPNTSKDDRKWIKEQIDQMDQVIENVVEHRAPYRAIVRFVIPSVRRQMRYKKLIQQLEQLVNNELYVKSNALKALDT